MAPTIDHVASTLRAGRSLLVIATAVVLGLLVSPPSVAGALVTPMVVLLLYTSFRSFSLDVVSRRSAAALGLALVIGSLVVPVSAAIVGPRFLQESTFLGVFVILAGPTTVGSAIVWTRIDDGDVALTTLIATVSVALSPFVVPALFAGLLSTSVSIDTLAIARSLLVALLGGVVLWRLVPEGRVGERTVDRVAIFAIAVLVYVAVGTNGFAGTTWWNVLVVVLAALLVDVAVLVFAAIGGRVLRLSAPQRRSVVYGAGLKNLGVALLVAASVPTAPVLPIVVFYVVQQLVSSVRAEVGAVTDSRASERPL